jgi:hypothetical protein
MCRPRSLEGCVSTFCHVVVCRPSISFAPFNELILEWEIRQTHIVIRLIKEMNFKCRLLSA